jgi:hypothetical protein
MWNRFDSNLPPDLILEVKIYFLYIAILHKYFIHILKTNDSKKDEQNINIHVINTPDKKLERNSMASMSKVWLSI